jgi:hypothetical protein
MREIKYWIVVVSKDHLQNGIKGGFMQANHGKPTLLKRLQTGDWVIFYSPKVSYEGKEKLQAFTAIGTIKDEELYQVEMMPGFNPYRRNVNFLESKEVSILPLIEGLDFIKNKKSWGYAFRFGYLEVGEEDFDRISGLMLDT